MAERKHRVLIIYDISKQTSTGETIGWAYYNRAKALQDLAPDDFTVDIVPFNAINWPRAKHYDLIFNIEYAAPSGDNVRRHAPNTLLVVSYNSDSRRRVSHWKNVRREAHFTICNNLEIFEHHGREHGTCCISNGVDVNRYRVTVPIAERSHRVLWCGSSGPTKGKGYHDVFLPMKPELERFGFEVDLRPINDIDERIVFPAQKQVDWYNSGSYVLCASLSEGTPNTSLEGMACGCVLVSTAVGNVQEFGKDKENCVIAERSAGKFVEALCYARDNRERLSEAGEETMRGWRYDSHEDGRPGRASYFYALFRRLIQDGPACVKPFYYAECEPGEI